MDLGSIIVTAAFVLFVAAVVWVLTLFFGTASWMPLILGIPLGYGVGMLLFWILGKIGRSSD